MSMPMQAQAELVPQWDRHTAETRVRREEMLAFRQRWAWAKASVWTEKMLTALETGVKVNAFFTRQGLLSLHAAHASLVNPLKR